MARVGISFKQQQTETPIFFLPTMIKLSLIYSSTSHLPSVFFFFNGGAEDCSSSSTERESASKSTSIFPQSQFTARAIHNYINHENA